MDIFLMDCFLSNFFSQNFGYIQMKLLKRIAILTLLSCFLLLNMAKLSAQTKDTLPCLDSILFNLRQSTERIDKIIKDADSMLQEKQRTDSIKVFYNSLFIKQEEIEFIKNL